MATKKKEEIKTTNIKISIYKKLHTIQSKVKGLSKDKKGHNYNYVTGNKLLSFIKPLMEENNLILKQEILSIDNERMDYKTKYGEKSEILTKVMMRFTWIDCETGETDVNLFGANGQNDWEKGLGSALTYAERYFLLKYFHISTDEDDVDNPDRKKEKAIQAPPKSNKNPVEDKPTEKAIMGVNHEHFQKTLDYVAKECHKGLDVLISNISKRFKLTPAVEKAINKAHKTAMDLSVNREAEANQAN